MVKELAEKLAQIHYLKVPIKRKNYLFDLIDKNYHEAYEKFQIDQLIDQLNLDCLKNNDIKYEIQFIKNVIIQLNSPIVFCHNDFRNSNILVRENNQTHKLTICDFEYGYYGYRGFDLGFLFSNWGGRTLLNEATTQDFDDSNYFYFLKCYKKACIRINGENYSKNQNNSLEKLINEAKVFHLLVTLWGCVFCLQCEENLFGNYMGRDMMMVRNYNLFIIQNYNLLIIQNSLFLHYLF